MKVFGKMLAPKAGVVERVMSRLVDLGCVLIDEKGAVTIGR